MGIKALYRDDYPAHLLVAVPNLASKILLDAYREDPDGSDVIVWLNQNAPGWELCYLISRPVTFQVDDDSETCIRFETSETCIRFVTSEQATLFRMFFG